MGFTSLAVVIRLSISVSQFQENTFSLFLCCTCYLHFMPERWCRSCFIGVCHYAAVPALLWSRTGTRRERARERDSGKKKAPDLHVSSSGEWSLNQVTVSINLYLSSASGSQKLAHHLVIFTNGKYPHRIWLWKDPLISNGMAHQPNRPAGLVGY